MSGHSREFCAAAGAGTLDTQTYVVHREIPKSRFALPRVKNRNGRTAEAAKPSAIPQLLKPVIINPPKEAVGVDGITKLPEHEMITQVHETILDSTHSRKYQRGRFLGKV